MDKEAKHLAPSERAEKILNAINDEANANGKWNQFYIKKLEIYSEQISSEDEHQILLTEKALYEQESLKLNIEKKKLQKELKDLYSGSSVTTDSIKELKENIRSLSLEYNTQRENLISEYPNQGIKAPNSSSDNKMQIELEELIKSLNKNIDFADNDFTANCLDEFDKK